MADKNNGAAAKPISRWDNLQAALRAGDKHPDPKTRLLIQSLKVKPAPARR